MLRGERVATAALFLFDYYIWYSIMPISYDGLLRIFLEMEIGLKGSLDAEEDKEAVKEDGGEEEAYWQAC